MLPALAQISDMTPLLGGTVDSARAGAALDSASALVRSYTGYSFTNPDGTLVANLPDAVVIATRSVAIRVYSAPDDGVTQETIGPYSVSRSGGLWLSNTDQILLKPYLASGGMQSISPRSMSTLWDFNNRFVAIDGEPDADMVELTSAEVAMGDDETDDGEWGQPDYTETPEPLSPYPV